MSKSLRRFRIETVLESLATPVFVLNPARVLVFFNAGCEQLTGWSAHDVLGRECVFATSPDRASLEALTGALCPPPEVLRGEHHPVAKFFAHKETGQNAARMVHYFPLVTSNEVTSIIGVITEVPRPKPTADTSLITQVHAELAALRQELRMRSGLKSLIAKSLPMQRVVDQINAARRSMVAVAISGEPGTGKEQVARAIHYESEFAAKTFVPIDCERLPAREVRDAVARLVESDWNEMTPIAAMHPGCIYLRAVDHLPRDLQQRFVDFTHSERGAAFRQRARLIVSSNDSLQSRLDQDQISEEFFFLVSGLQIELPPLRQRLGELRLFAQLFVEECNRSRKQQVSGLAADVCPLLEAYNWPGNLDELRQVITDAHSACAPLTQVTAAHLPFRFRTGLDAQSLAPGPSQVFEPLSTLLERVEREQIEAALRQAGSNKAKAAKLLGITRHSLYRRMEVLGLEHQNDDASDSQ